VRRHAVVPLDEPGALVRSDQVRSVYRLLNEARELALREDSRSVKAHVIRGLCNIVGACAGALVVDEDHLPGRPGRLTSVVAYGSSSGCAQLAHEFLTRGPAVDPAVASLRAHTGAVVTGTRQDLVPDALWYGDGFVADVCKSANLDHAIYSKRDGGMPGRIDGMRLDRPWGDKPFASEDRNLIHLFQLEAKWLYQTGDSVERAEKALSPRERETLRHLLTGTTEKEIAAGMGLSIHTVHQYVKRIYAQFGVTSRNALLLQCLSLGGSPKHTESRRDG
jgi:DNA-binding CsgD family transcriptional regulator